MLEFSKSVLDLIFVFNFRIQTGEEPAVKSAAVVFKDLCYQYRDQFSSPVGTRNWVARFTPFPLVE